MDKFCTIDALINVDFPSAICRAPNAKATCTPEETQVSPTHDSIGASVISIGEKKCRNSRPPEEYVASY